MDEGSLKLWIQVRTDDETLSQYRIQHKMNFSNRSMNKKDDSEIPMIKNKEKRRKKMPTTLVNTNSKIDSDGVGVVEWQESMDISHFDIFHLATCTQE